MTCAKVEKEGEDELSPLPFVNGGSYVICLWFYNIGVSFVILSSNDNQVTADLVYTVQAVHVHHKVGTGV